ncbi:MAG TPA: ATPase, T2SS/T4P/T4SS family [Alphaproteobacteria bacterium]
MNEQYLDFDEAVAFLKTNSSTLYKWLQSGKVPGHKLGRQWRFLRDELEMHISGKLLNIHNQHDVLALANMLKPRLAGRKAPAPQDMPGLTEALIWDGFYQEATAIHLAPSADQYTLSYRIRAELKPILTLSEGLFQALHQALLNMCEPAGSDDARRAYLQHNEEDACLVTYQRVDTRMGAHVTLQLREPYRDVPTLNQIVPNATDYAVLQQWLAHNHGIIAITGAWGSGKTTTTVSCLDYLKEQGKIVFSLEDDDTYIVPGIHQIELRSGQVAAFEQHFAKIMASDADVICLILNSYTNLREIVLHAAYRAATTGHLVILHMNAPSCDVALNQIKQVMPDVVDEKLLIGISSQTLISSDTPTRKANFQLMRF